MTEVDDGALVTLHVAETLLLSLPENASTGYRWTFESIDSALIDVQENPFASPRSGNVGDGGTASWTLRAKAVGITEIRLRLWRRWEGDSSVKSRFSATITITEP